MTPTSGGPAVRRSRTYAFAGVLAIALLARIAVLLTLRHDVAIRVPLLDAYHYMTTAVALAAGEGWPPGPHFNAPIYPFLLAGLFRVAPASVETVQWAQLLLGLATTALVLASAWRIAGRSAGIAAGLLYALCGPAIVYENQVLLEALLAFCLAAYVLLLGSPGAGPIRFALAGLATGIAAAGRPTYALLILPLLAVAWTAKAGARIRLLAAALAAFLLVVVPPSVHNTRATGRLSFITVSGGLNLWIGNHPGASGGYSEPGGLFLEKDPTGARSASSMAGRRLDAGEASSFFARKALDFLIHRPGEAARLVARKAGYLFSPAEVPQIESMDRLASEHPLLAVLRWIGFPFFLPLALLGIARRRRDRTIRFAASVLLAGAVAHLVFFSTGRYRAAMLPALAVAAGAGVVELLSMIRERQAGRLLLPRRLWPVALGLLLLLLAPRYDRRTAAAWAFHQDGIRYQKLGASRSAAEMFHQALALDPSLGEAWHNLGVIEASEGAVAEAIRDYERALAEIGENPVTLYNLASLYGRIGSDEKALAYLDRSLRADPSAPEVRVDRGIALYRLARKQEAFEEWRRVAREAPGEPTLAATLQRVAAAGGELPPDLARLASGSPPASTGR